MRDNQNNSEAMKNVNINMAVYQITDYIETKFFLIHLTTAELN